MKKLLKSALAILLKIPLLNAAALECLGLGLLICKRRFNAQPGLYLTAYRGLRFALRRMAPGAAAAAESEEGGGPLIAKAWRRLDGRLHRAIRRFLKTETDSCLVRHINHAITSYEADERIVRAKGFPFRMNVELTSACNLRCPMCPQATVQNITRVYLDLDRMDQIGPALRYAEQVSLVGFGETFLHRDFRSFLKRVKRPGACVRIITNGVLLTRDLAFFLVAHQLDELWVSIDAVTPQTYRTVRGADCLEKIKANLRHLNDLKRTTESELPALSFTFVAMASNIDELPDYVRMARDFGAVAVHVNYVIVYHESMTNESLFYEPEKANRRLREARQAAEELGIEFHAPDAFDLSKHAKSPPTEDSAALRQAYRRCREPWEFAYFSCTGHVVPCCTEHARLGDLKERAFEDVWDSPAYRAYRRRLSTDNPSKFCRNCMQAAQRGVDDPDSHFRILAEDGQLA